MSNRWIFFNKHWKNLNWIKLFMLYWSSGVKLQLYGKELYKIKVLLKYAKPNSQHYFEKYFLQSNIDWKKIYVLPRVVTVDNRIRVFQYEVLNNILFLNEIWFKFGIVFWSLCSFCNSEEETPFHIFHDCIHRQQIFVINFRHTLARILSFHF